MVAFSTQTFSEIGRRTALAGRRAAAEVARGDPASEIVKSAEKAGADLIVLSTHRKAGIGAFWARSVAPNVANHSTLPLLLIPLK